MYRGKKVLDVHGHQTTPPEFEQFGNQLLRLRKLHGDDRLVLADDLVTAAVQPHVALLDQRQVDLQLLSPRPVDMWHWEVPEVQTVWCRATNDVTNQICRLFPGRFAGMAQLPQHVSTSTANCIQELDRCINELGFVGAIVNPDPGADGRAPTMADEYWYPLYEWAEEAGVVLMIHGSISRDPRWAMVPHGYQVNNVISQYIATLTLENSDVFAHFPNLKTYVCHLGGSLNRWPKEDLEHQYGTLPVSNLKFDSVAYDAGFLELGIRQKGADRVLFGSECPGAGTGTVIKEPGKPDRASDDLLPVIDAMEFLTDDEKLDIVHNNALKFFPLLASKVTD